MDEALPVDSPRSGFAPASPTNKSHGRFIPTLLRKNWLLKRKHPVAVLFEIVAPTLFILILNIIKSQSHTYDVPAGFTLDTQSTNLFAQGGYSLMAPMTTPAVAVSETTVSGLFLHLGELSFQRARNKETLSAANAASCELQLAIDGKVSLNVSSPYALPHECEGKVSPFKLAIVPNTTFTRSYFYETMKSWYPTIAIPLPSNASRSTLVIPSFEDSTIFFDTEEDLEAYVKSDSYAKTANQSRIFGAIVFNEYPTDVSAIGKPASIEYTIRMNSTFVGDSDTNRYVPQTVDKDGASAWDPFQRDLDTTNYQQYTTNGFMTLQTLVTRFVNCMPDWDAASEQTTTTCQVNTSVALSSDQLDAQLLQAISQDPVLLQVWDTISFATGSSLDPSSLGPKEREALLQPLRVAPQPYLGALTSPYPINSFAKSSFYDTIKDVFPILFILAFLHPLSRMLVSFLSERETRSRELMKILGVKESSIVTSWYITYTVVIVLASVCEMAVAKAGLFEASDPLLLFLFFFLFSMSALAFAFLVSSIFSKSRTGAYVGFIGFFAMYAVSNAFTDSSLESSKNIACLLTPVALVFGVNSLATVETSHIGMNFGNASLRVNNFRFSTSLWFFALNTVWYTLLGLYLEKVVPKTYGTTEKWYFPLKLSYWRKSSRYTAALRSMSFQHSLSEGVTVPVNPNIELVGEDLQEQEYNGEALSIQRLRKVFPVPGGEKEAVKGLSLNMYAGQITCLLGHNGAGKTTLISMLTGVLDATSGGATFRGLSLREDMGEIRESLGICFQHDVLYPELTVEDHLEFYARIKGYTGDALKAEVASKIAEVGLSDKAKTLSSALSGGMKRKLSVAISLLGESSLVFLDEPTSGMDPYSRRRIWEILMNNRQGRVMVLTTHFMDEADILGDRIAIMAEGELRCCGSPLFLKNRYGAGYNLTIVKEEGCDDSKVIDFVTKHVPSCSVLSNVGTEVAFQLPLSASASFAEMFKDLDSSLQHLALLSYGISVTTMEEVFIKVAEAADGDDEQQHTLVNKVKKHSPDHRSGTNLSSEEGDEQFKQPQASKALTNQSEKSVFFIQLVALLQKRFRIAKRDKRMVITSLFLPIAWLVLGLSILSAATLTKSDPKMSLDIANLASEVTTHQVSLPSYCEQSQGNWCEAVITNPSFAGASPTLVGEALIGNPPYSTNSPSVFGIVYDDPSINRTDGSGYLLRLSEVVYTRAYQGGTKDQFGGYLVHSDSNQQVFGYNVLVNTTLPHGSVVFKALIDQSLYRYMASTVTGTSVDTTKLTLKVNSHPLPLTSTTTALFGSYLSFSACMFVVIAFGYYPASIVVLLVKERQPEHNSKHQQLVSGVGIPAFWLANYIWDMAIYLIPCVAALILLQVYDVPALNGSDKCITCGNSTFPAVIILFVLFGLAICPHAYCWSFILKDPPSSQTFMIMINFILGLALMVTSFVLRVIDSTKSLNDVLIFLFRLSPLFNLGTGLLNLTIIEITHTGGAQPDKEISTNPFALENMGWEMIFLCFGFLGINGAGKTTTMKMLTGDIVPTSGTASLCGFDILSQQLDVRRRIGYCPQFDALIDLLSVREHLELFAKIKGVSNSDLDAVVREKLTQLNLSAFEDKLAGSLSGGNKRKLSVAMAMIGSPSILFLDEPSTGMDPVSRRFMWDVISEISTYNKESTVMLTTHSMEECEALCTRVGIMVGGSMKCLGSVQHLKSRFGEGLMFDAKLQPATTEDVRSFAVEYFNTVDAQIRREELAEICGRLGNMVWESKISGTHKTGYTLAHSLDRDGYILASTFAAWWLNELKFERVSSFLADSFGSVELLERRNDSCWFKIHSSTTSPDFDANSSPARRQDALRLASVFELIENAKQSLEIREYSVSQTTLEQIFNSFAIQQDVDVPIAVTPTNA
uniref:ABC transporter domain-containing protein n=1 Tax=Globisporangium ultimum (strain ATCC 200006 / CBS 805.95 / DAOM BR144) TaxID=431595 RepID=K3WB22_GLOUD